MTKLILRAKLQTRQTTDSDINLIRNAQERAGGIGQLLLRNSHGKNCDINSRFAFALPYISSHEPRI